MSTRSASSSKERSDDFDEELHGCHRSARERVSSPFVWSLTFITAVSGASRCETKPRLTNHIDRRLFRSLAFE